MFHGYYVFNRSVACYLVLYLITNAVADISLDYYFGKDASLRSAHTLEDCKGEDLINYCYEKCGPHHACLMGRCFCADVKTPTINIESLVSEESSSEDTASKSIEVSDEDAEEESSEVLHLNDEVLAARPTLRHHIAHFCPNLKKARECITKCMKRRLPAFCGKDHHCYCGHRYDGIPGKPRMTEDELQNQFADLYTKYFGPRTTRQLKEN